MTTNTDGSPAGREEPGSTTTADPDLPPESARAAAPRAAAGVSIEISVEGGVAGAAIDVAWVRERLAEALGHVDRPCRRLTLLLVDDDRIRDLALRHGRRGEVTDVLAFPASGRDEGAGETQKGPIDADVAANVDEAVRQARQRGHSVERELLLYAVHGLLHCAGFDDHGTAAFDRMHAEEDRILRAIGVGPIFAEGGPSERTGEGADGEARP